MCKCQEKSGFHLHSKLWSFSPLIITVDVKLNISEETVNQCLTLLNMYLQGSTMEAIVARKTNGDTEVMLVEKE